MQLFSGHCAVLLWLNPHFKEHHFDSDFCFLVQVHSACLRPFQIEALKHAFVTIAGGMRFDHRVRTSKILDVCLTAGFRPDSKEVSIRDNTSLRPIFRVLGF
jgi:hypothetical protein